MPGSRTNRKSNPTRAKSNNNKRYSGVKQAAKNKHQKWSRDRSERVRDALNRDADVLYNVLENPATAPSMLSQDSIVLLAESMQDLGT